MSCLQACLFDLDGVIVDTAKYHYVAWREIARELGFAFTQAHNERLKGVSRQQSLEILLEIGNVKVGKREKERLAEKKNALYLQLIMKMMPAEILPGAVEFITACRSAGYRTALATASRNADVILDLLKIKPLFDVVMDGNKVSRTKPDPEVFLNCARDLSLEPQDCVVFEDAVAGIEAARSAHMLAIGIGNPDILTNADFVVPGLNVITLDDLRAVNKKSNTVARV